MEECIVGRNHDVSIERFATGAPLRCNPYKSQYDQQPATQDPSPALQFESVQFERILLAAGLLSSLGRLWFSFLVMRRFAQESSGSHATPLVWGQCWQYRSNKFLKHAAAKCSPFFTYLS